jgi:aryl-alcohol dehydrogenase-like predicted oxidoreductase
LLKAAWEKGVTTWDTANVYSNGESERIIGKALKQVHRPVDSALSSLTKSTLQFNIPRHRITILTKCFMPTHDDDVAIAQGFGLMSDPGRDYVNNWGLSRQAIFNQVDASLKRLDTPYIDLLQIHRADLKNTTAEETMKALHDLVQSGKVRYIGASSMWAWQLAHYNAVAEKVCRGSLPQVP